jgi:alcohol dehydrogenase (NADP+)
MPGPGELHPHFRQPELRVTDADMKAIAVIERHCRLVKGQVFLWREGQRWEDLWDIDGRIAQ